jgi:uncharacterized oligopeptide transporter (OPT) family protein
VGATPRLQQIAILLGALASALVLGPILLRLNDGATVYLPVPASATLRTEASALTERARLKGPQGSADPREYRVWHKTDEPGGQVRQYLVDDSGLAIYRVDPGINGTESRRPDGTEVRKFDAPKATLMSYIIKGILDRQLPWSLVLLGVMISVTLELCGVPSLAFAVGVYLPLSSSSPIFIGGLIRWLIDRQRRHRLRHARLSEDQLAAEADKSPGVLTASGYIAGGAIAGIVIAFMAGFLEEVDRFFTTWALSHNPFYAGPVADLLALIPFLLLVLYLYLSGRDRPAAPPSPT